MSAVVRSVALFVSVVCCAVVACVDTAPLHEPEIVSSHVEIKELPAGWLPKLDVLIVIDDTAAMAPYQDRVETELAPLVAQHVGSFTRNWFDIQIAVTGNSGTFRRLTGADTMVLAEAWQLDYTREASFAGPLDAALADVLHADALADEAGQPLEAMRRALERNALFVRDDAALAVLVVTAGDDASPLAVGEYTRWMRALGGDDGGGWARKPIVVVGIHPRPAPRLDEYYASLGAGTAITVADVADDWAAPVAKLEPRIRTLLGAFCLEIDDLDHRATGVQHDCAMHAYLGDSLRSVPECSAARIGIDRSSNEVASTAPEPACWELVPDPVNCFYAGAGLTMRFRGYTSISHPAYRLECRTR